MTATRDTAFVETPLDGDASADRPPAGGDVPGENPPADHDAGGSGPRAWLRAHLAPVAAAITLIAVVVGSLWAWQVSQRVAIEDAAVSAPSSTAIARGGGVLKEVYASVGDSVEANRPIARLGNEVISSDFTGTVVSIRQDLGAYVAPGQTVATLIDRNGLRAVGRVDEDEGLADLRIGQRAVVTVDAFGRRELTGTVEEVSQQPRQQDIAFSISDTRETREYEVKVRFDGGPDLALQQGMSARLWVYK